MKSQTTSKDKGFTLIEVLVVMGIVAVLFAVGDLIDFGSLGRRTLGSEEVTLVSILQRARSESMNNINALPHGVHVEEKNFVIFEDSYDEKDSSNQKIPRNTNIDISPLDYEVTFAQLSGNPDNTDDISISDKVQTKTIKISEMGLIDW